MKRIGIALAIIAPFLIVGCNQEPTAEQINSRFAAQHTRSQVVIAQKEVELAELDEQIARELGKKIDPKPLAIAQAHLHGAKVELALLEDQEQLERNLAR